MTIKWNRREFILKTGTATLAAFGLPLAGMVSSCQSAEQPALGADGANLLKNFQDPPVEAKPWVFWYWMRASVSREGITADIEAMKAAGIRGAYLMPIKGVTDPPVFDPPAEQLSPEWWGMVQHAIREAERLGLKIAMHASDGFALAGGPWITPELSMQKVVWTETHLSGGSPYNGVLPQPQTNEGYYRDIAVLAFPTPGGEIRTTRTTVPKVTTSRPGEDASYLVAEGNGETFESEEDCWIQYAFETPFTCRSVTIRTRRNNYQAQRLLIRVSDDGTHFRELGRLVPPRHGWQDWDADVTHAIVPVTARFFRFYYDKAGTEPGAEDLDSAKWKPELKIQGITLSGAPRLNQFEGKTGEVWRISERTTVREIPDDLCVPRGRILDISGNLDADGTLAWTPPEGSWTVLRVGHTSTGHRNETGGAGSGLECDKFNPEAITLQFNNWFGAAFPRVGEELASRILKVFHVDSWECGSQNWSPVFREEFRERRGYDLMPYLPAMAGIPVESADISERFLHDVRQTIAELVVDRFFKEMARHAHAKGCVFSAENVCPTMTSDGMLHFDAVDIPMGEFWFRSPTHDKPNDMLDAISGAHIYGKQVIQAECFTQLRTLWDEHPGMLKTLGDRNYALGFNKFVYHVFTHNPWMDRMPGMTLDGIGLYFQRDQTWWKPGRAWVAYAERCQALLQQGRPVADIAVFTGEEIPRRAVLPDRLVPFLPGIFGAGVVAGEQERLANIGQPLREMPIDVMNSANTSDAEDWIDPLRGYAYDSINRDALLRLAKVRNGRIELPGGASYGLLLLPGPRRMSPHDGLMSPEVAAKLKQMVEAGATVILCEQFDRSPGLENYPGSDASVRKISQELWSGEPTEVKDPVSGSFVVRSLGEGRVIPGPFTAASFDALGIERDVIFTEPGTKGAKKSGSAARAEGVAWNHRTAPGFDCYFISNQQDRQRTIEVSLRGTGRAPQLLDPVTGEIRKANEWRFVKHRTHLPLRLAAGEAVFIVLQESTTASSGNNGKNWLEPRTARTLEGPWQVTFDPRTGGPEGKIIFDRLQDWSKRPEFGIRHFSGTASYGKTFQWEQGPSGQRVWLDLGKVANMGEVILNGTSCGVAWTPPYRVEITGALQNGENKLTIEVTNTWANRIKGDQSLPESERITWTNAPYRLEERPLLTAGLLGPVTIRTS